MKVINAGYEILECPANVLENIERSARTCYKSEDKITSGSAKALVQRLLAQGHLAMIEFGGSIVVKFFANRGFSHELVRHRVSSLAQESTRYCNYGKAKFGREITVCDPKQMLRMKLPEEDKSDIRVRLLEIMLRSWEQSETAYFEMLELGAPPEVAREVLPIGLKTEIVIAANTREWMHIFDQRCSPAAHPRMREVMIPLRADLRRRVPILFDER